MAVTPPNCKILYDNFGLQATWTASSSVPTLPASNLAQPARQRAWRSLGDTSEWVRADLGLVRSVEAIAIVSHNLTTAAIVTIQAHDADVWTSPLFSASLIPWNQGASGVWVRMFPVQTYRYWRIVLADPNNTDGYLQIGMIALGPLLTLGGPQEFEFELIDPSPVSYSVGGTPYGFEMTPYLQAALRYSVLDESTAFGLLQTAIRTAGRRRDCILSVFADDPDADIPAITLNLYGRLMDVTPVAHHRESVTRYEVGLTFRESL
jgi:hypothetical protein